MLYTNGDSHTAGAEAVNSYAFANDDPKYWHLERRPHPDNFAVSWTPVLAHLLKMSYHTDAESASSNDRIIRTTNEWLEHNEDIVDFDNLLIIIQWSTWEREEWFDSDTNEYYQVNASGVDTVPDKWKDDYKEYVANINWQEKTEEAFEKISAFHRQLKHQGINHIFFNGNNAFNKIPEEMRYDFGKYYIGPYLPEETFDGYLRNQGFDTVITSNYHYGPEAHAAWAKRLLKHIIENKMI